MKEKDFREKFEIMKNKYGRFNVVALKQGREIVIIADSYKMIGRTVTGQTLIVGFRYKDVPTGLMHLKDVAYFEYAGDRLY